jgi:uncharacterized protein YdeI (BOF family)
MALIPLNTFKTKTAVLTTGTTATIYTAPIGVTTIILMAQIANISTQTQTVTFAHHRNLPVLPDSQGNGAQDPNVTTETVKDFQIPANDAASVLQGKMVIESLDSVRAYASDDNVLKVTLSILETANA